MEGTDLFEAMRVICPETIAIMISARATVDEAVSALKLGIYDLSPRIFAMQEIRKVVSKGLETQQLLQENLRLRQALQDRLATVG